MLLLLLLCFIYSPSDISLPRQVVHVPNKMRAMKQDKAKHASQLLPFLNIWPDINLPRERRPRLRMQMPIRICNAIRADHAISNAIIYLDVLRARAIDDAVDNGMRNMDALGAEFAR